MDLSPRWVGVFAEAGIKAVHWSTVGAATAPDPEIMAYAKAEDYVVFTHGLDFGAILAATHGDKPSVVQIRSGNVSPDAIGPHAVAALVPLVTRSDNATNAAAGQREPLSANRRSGFAVFAWDRSRDARDNANWHCDY